MPCSVKITLAGDEITVEPYRIKVVVGVEARLDTDRPVSGEFLEVDFDLCFSLPYNPEAAAMAVASHRRFIEAFGGDVGEAAEREVEFIAKDAGTVTACYGVGSVPLYTTPGYREREFTMTAKDLLTALYAYHYTRLATQRGWQGEEPSEADVVEMLRSIIMAISGGEAAPMQTRVWAKLKCLSAKAEYYVESKHRGRTLIEELLLLLTPPRREKVVEECKCEVVQPGPVNLTL